MSVLRDTDVRKAGRTRLRPEVEALAARGMAYERLDQLALEHLYGVR